MKSIIYTVEVEASKSEGIRNSFIRDLKDENLENWYPGDFYSYQEVVHGVVDQLDLMEFDSYTEGAKVFDSLRSTRHRNGSRWEVTLKVIEKLDDDGEFMEIDFAPFKEEEL